ncbi:MAG: hypothetical protein ACYC7A_17970 [Thermoanaerobaculia bacterium]
MRDESETKQFIRRGLLLAAGGFAAVAALLFLWNFFAARFERTTGRAEWIWPQHRIAADEPIVFFTARTFDLPPRRSYTRIKVASDPEYTLFFNGVELGGGRSHGHVAIDVFDASALARDSGNRIVIAVRSARGVGGVLAAVDCGSMLENVVVSDSRWEIYRSWDPRLLLESSPQSTKPRVFGRPPHGRWNFPGERTRDAYPVASDIVAPRRVENYETRLPVIRVVGGVAIATSVASRATAFDFGAIEGRARFEVAPGPRRVVNIRLANHPRELEAPGELLPIVIAEGERVVVDPETRRFRLIVVHDSDAVASVKRPS